jgi:hypothetical protein
VQGSVDNVVITGAANFKVYCVKTDPDNLRADVVISFDAVRVEGEHCKLERYILNGLLPVEGEGRFELSLLRYLATCFILQYIYKFSIVPVCVNPYRPPPHKRSVFNELTNTLHNYKETFIELIIFVNSLKMLISNNYYYK